MDKLILIIIYFTLFYITIRGAIKIYKIVKETRNNAEKAIYTFLAAAILTPFIILLLDIYNVPSFFKYTDNINKSDWLNFSGSYLSTIISTLISTAFLIYVTKIQIERTYKDNEELNRESYRIQNLPYLQYSFDSKIEDAANLNKTKHIYLDSKSKYDSVEFSLSIKNIGLNAVRKTYLSLESNILKDIEITSLSEQGCINKDEIKKKDFWFNSLKDGNYIMYINVYYQDLMRNWYCQRIKLNLNITSIYDPRRQCNIRFKVYEEEKISKFPKLLNDYIKKYE